MGVTMMPKEFLQASEDNALTELLYAIRISPDLKNVKYKTYENILSEIVSYIEDDINKELRLKGYNLLGPESTEDGVDFVVGHSIRHFLLAIRYDSIIVTHRGYIVGRELINLKRDMINIVKKILTKINDITKDQVLADEAGVRMRKTNIIVLRQDKTMLPCPLPSGQSNLIELYKTHICNSILLFFNTYNFQKYKKKTSEFNLMIRTNTTGEDQVERLILKIADINFLTEKIALANVALSLISGITNYQFNENIINLLLDLAIQMTNRIETTGNVNKIEENIEIIEENINKIYSNIFEWLENLGGTRTRQEEFERNIYILPFPIPLLD